MKGTRRIGKDGLVLCRDCEQRKLPTSFPTNPAGYPDSYCYRCRSKRTTREQQARAVRDPGWYERRMRRGVVNNRKRRARQGQDRLKLAQGAIAWMESRGFYQQEIAALVGCYPRTVQFWRAGTFGAKGYPTIGDRLIALHQVTSDLPPWPDRRRQRDKTHPWFALVAARLEQTST